MQFRKFHVFWSSVGLAIGIGYAQQIGGLDHGEQSTPDTQAETKPNPHAGHQMPTEKKDENKQGRTKEMDHSQMPGMDHSKMAGMDRSQMPGMQHTMDMNEAGMILMNQASGTSINPQSWPMPMLMTRFGSWHSTFMGNGFIVDTQQSGPRGHDKFYSPNWLMASAEHSVGTGSFMFQLMFSLDPATVTQRRYPELFQTGETAFGKAIVDAQHPHDLIVA